MHNTALQNKEPGMTPVTNLARARNRNQKRRVEILKNDYEYEHRFTEHEQ